METIFIIFLFVFAIFIISLINQAINEFIYYWENKKDKNIFHYFVDILIFFYKILKMLLYIFSFLVVLNMIFGDNDNDDCNDYDEDCDY